MLLIIYLPIMGLGVALLFCYSKSFEKGYVVQSFVGTVFGVVVATLVSLLVMSFADTQRVHHSRWSLHAMHGSNMVTGSFFLGSGSLDGKPCYTYYYIDKDSAGTFYVPRTIPVDNVTIYEEDRSDGELEVTVEVFLDPTLNLISAPYPSYYYAFHIPRGSIVQQFSL